MGQVAGPPFKGIDEAWQKASPETLKQQGYTFVAGYVSEDTTGKNLTRADINAYHRAGLDVVLVYEYRTNAGGLGYDRGVRDAKIAVKQARALDAPAGTSIYFALDYQITAVGLTAPIQYIQGADSICAANGYRADAYGDYVVIKALLDRGIIRYGWETYAWSGGKWEPRSALRQTRNGIHVGTANVDLDSAQRSEFGQWRPDGATGNGAITVSLTDDIIRSFALGQQHTKTGTVVAPVQWRIRDEAWQASVNSMLKGLHDAQVGMTQDLTALNVKFNALGAALAQPVSGGDATPPEQQLLALYGRIAVALESIAAHLSPATPPATTPDAPAPRPQLAAVPQPDTQA